MIFGNLTVIDIITALEKELNQFLAGKQPNAWLNVDDGYIVQVYCRKGARHRVNGTLTTTFDIANINVEKPGHGIGSAVINLIHRINPYPVTYIENVLNDRFYTYLIRHDWKDVEINRFDFKRTPSVYKLAKSSAVDKV